MAFVTMAGTETEETPADWYTEKVQSRSRVLGEDALVMPGYNITTSDEWTRASNWLRSWVSTKARHHLYIEVRSHTQKKPLYGPLKIYIHDLANYAVTMDTVWAHIEQHRATAEEMFDEENDAYIKSLDAAYAMGATQHYSPLLGEYAIHPDGTVTYFIGSDELSAAREEADNFYVVFSVNPFETKGEKQQQRRKQRETNHSVMLSMLTGLMDGGQQ